MIYGHLTWKGSVLSYLGFSIQKENQRNTRQGTKSALKFLLVVKTPNSSNVYRESVRDHTGNI